MSPQKKSPRCRRLSISIGAAYRIPRIRLRGSAPASAACRRPRPLATDAPRPLYARASTEVRIHAVPPQKKRPRCRRLSISIGAAYRIRTYDVLIRSQTLYPAEVTPRLVDYYAQRLNNGQAFFRKKLSNLIFTHLRQFGAAWIGRHSKPVTQLYRHIKKPPLPEAFKINWCGV